MRRERSVRRSPVLLCLVAAVVAGACSSGSSRGATATSTSVDDVATIAPIEPIAVVDGEASVVQYLQEALRELGVYSGPIDGQVDADLTAALSAFQRSKGLPTTARLDAATAFALAKASPTTYRLAIEALQSQLIEVGAYHGAIDGNLTADGMDAAIRSVQQQAGITVDGVFGPKTFAALQDRYHAAVGAAIDTAILPAPSTTSVPSTTAATTTVPSTSTSTTTTASVAPTTAKPSAATTTTTAGGDASLRQVQARLAALGYRPGTPDGHLGVQTTSALLAFQKREGLPRTGTLTSAVVARLQRPIGKGPRSSAPGPRVEIDLDRQILFFVDRTGTVTTLNTSTGSGKPYRDANGKTVIAYTPTGSFRVERRISGIRKAPLGSLYWPLYFHGGWAIHGSPVVPAYPASHGCARLANWDQDFVFAALPNGAPVVVYGTPKGTASGAEAGY